MGLLNEEIDRQAAKWAARVAGGDVTPDELACLEAWLAADTRHLGAYGRVVAGLMRLERLRAVGAAALRTPPAGFSPLLPSASVFESCAAVAGIPHPPANSPHWTRRRVVLTGSTAASVAAAGIVGASLWLNHQPTEFATGVGQTRAVTLSDGSVVTLNTASRISVDFSNRVRRVRLAQGEVLFAVAKNKLRPFIVEAGDSEVRAVGTSFTVRVLPQYPIRILVQEGVVEVSRRDERSAPAVRAIAETQTLVPRDAPIITRAVSRPVVARDLAWQFGQIAFENEKLADAAEEFARYSNTRIVVDPAVADYTVTGMFASNDPVGFAKAVASALKIRVVVETNEVRVFN